MKTTGIIRRIDELGRIVIPKEIRKNMRIDNGESLEIFVDEENIILKKYSPIESLNTVAEKYVDIFNQVIKHNIIVTDRNKVIAIAGNLKKQYLNKEISEFTSHSIDRRDSFVERQKKPIKVFDLREFVKEKRKQKFMSMVDGSGMPQGGNIPPIMPGINAPNNIPDLFGANPFNGVTSNEKSENGGLNVDELVKKIDAKIAELEKEEAMEKARLEQEKNNKKEENEEKPSEEIKNEPKEQEISKSVSNIAPTKLTGFLNNTENNEKENKGIKRVEPVKNSEVSKYAVTDDQFFDDFFDE